jgi:hypothetical protein
MKHATPATLSGIAELLAGMRAYEALTERKPGIFYRKSSAFLHFHEDPAGLFADVKLGKGFERMPVNSREEQIELLRRVERVLQPAAVR